MEPEAGQSRSISCISHGSAFSTNVYKSRSAMNSSAHQAHGNTACALIPEARRAALSPSYSAPAPQAGPHMEEAMSLLVFPLREGQPPRSRQALQAGRTASRGPRLR